MTGTGESLLTLAETLRSPAGALSLGWSRTLCRNVDQSGHNCAAYHGIWPYVLRFGMAHSPQHQREFYRAAIGEAINSSRGRRILASGAADYSLPATLLWACAQAEVTPDLTVADICETPLRLCAWFGKVAGVPLEIAVADILTYRPARPYDIVAAHSFLGYFAPAARGRLVAAWHDLLVPGGRVVLVHRVRADAPDLIRFSASQGKEFYTRFLEQAVRHADELTVTPEALAALSDGFVAHSVFHPLRSGEELAALFEVNGFSVTSLTIDPIDPAGPSTSPGPILAGGVEYAKLVAIRR
jgi:hypothetical protein